jgi:hypothetical protein
MTAFKLLGFFAGAVLLASASVAFGSDFNPQPDPPGRHGVTAGTHADFNPQPDPPGRHKTNTAASGCSQGIGKRDAASGLPSGKRTAGSEQRKSGGQRSSDSTGAGCQ